MSVSSIHCDSHILLDCYFVFKIGRLLDAVIIGFVIACASVSVTVIICFSALWDTVGIGFDLIRSVVSTRTRC